MSNWDGKNLQAGILEGGPLDGTILFQVDADAESLYVMGATEKDPDQRGLRFKRATPVRLRDTDHGPAVVLQYMGRNPE